ncbi:glycerophosphodiester phosphodiesterase [Robertkochia marina]
MQICIFFLSFAALNVDTEKPMVIGHRGAKGHVAENTMASIAKALELGVDGIEIDVFRIRSGEVVVFHDDYLGRLTDQTGKIEDLTLEELQKVRVKGNYRIPTLEEVLHYLDGRVLLNIELKGSGTAAPVYHTLERYLGKSGWTHDNLLISSFKWEELESYRTLDKKMPIGVLTEKEISPAIAMAKSLNAVAVNADHHLLTEETAGEIRKAGLQIWCWTVNRMPDLERMFELKVEAVITDYPDRVND